MLDILSAGLRAPSPKNRQPWYFFVSKSKEKRGTLIDSVVRSICAALENSPERTDIAMALESTEILRQAPVVVFVCYRPGTAEAHDDGVNWPMNATDLEVVELLSVGAAVENMLLKAEELGLGGLWCGDVLYAYKTIMSILQTSYRINYSVGRGFTRPRFGLCKSANRVAV